MKTLESGVTLLSLLAMLVLLLVSTTVHAGELQEIELLLKKGQGLYQLKQYDDSIVVFEDIDKRFGKSEDAKIRERVASALGFKGLALGGKGYRGKAIEIWEEADRRYSKDSDPAMRATLARLLYNKIITLVGLSIRGSHKNQQAEFDAAMAAFEEFDQRYGNDKDPAIRENAAWAFIQKSRALGHRFNDNMAYIDFSPYRIKEAVAVLDEMILRYGEDKDPSVRAVVAKAFFEKGGIFYQTGKTQEEIAAYDELDRRFGQDETPNVRVIVIQGLADKAWRLVQDANMSERTEEEYAPAISVMDEIVKRFGKDKSTEVQEQIIDVLFKKAGALFFMEEKAPITKIIAIYDNIDQIYGKVKTPVIRVKVAEALIEKGKLFIDLKQHKKALAVFDQIIQRYKGEKETSETVNVAKSFKNELSASGSKVLQNTQAEEDGGSDFRKRQSIRTNWVYATLKQDDVMPVIDRTLKDQQRWASLPENAPDSFHCTKLQLAPPSAAAQAAFEATGGSSRGQKAENAYAKAASLGHWRAAARLVAFSLEDEYWEGAAPIVAWLLVKHVPAGYNKLADIIEVSGGYDGAKLSDDSLNLVTSLRWRAAREGDPLAQSQMADILDELGKPDIAVSLRTCAIQQNPDLAK